MRGEVNSRIRIKGKGKYESTEIKSQNRKYDEMITMNRNMCTEETERRKNEGIKADGEKE
jgi:hypothetical protein